MDHNIRELASLTFEALRSPLSAALDCALRQGDGPLLSTTRVSPAHYNDPKLFARDYCSGELLRKFPNLPSMNVDRRKAAIDAFWEAERHCSMINERIGSITYGRCHHAYSDTLVSFLGRVRKRIRTWLGQVPEDWRFNANFGPGATYGNIGKRLTVADKIQDKPQSTASALNDYETLIDFLIGWGRVGDDPIIVRGNRFTTVPKDSTKDRGICIEPSINLFYQKAIGAVMRQKLRNVGIDLGLGQDRNGKLAGIGSKTGAFATIDLSSASDTVSYALVRHLLPKSWFRILCSTRSPTTEIEGEVVLLEKFSSMGNGFTFELETLIFTAIAAEVMDSSGVVPQIGHNVLCYGDDIIVPSSVSSTVLSALSFCGFKPNPKKTFHTTYFRESCGHDWFKGFRVIPLRIDGEAEDFRFWISTANRLREMFESLGMWGEPPVLKAWRFCINQIPLRNRLFGPKRLGDSVIHDLPGSWVVREGHKFNGLRHIPGTLWIRAHKALTVPVPWVHWSEDVMLATRVLNPSDYSRGLTGRGCKISLETGWVSVS